jgi:hypothetical protein
MCSKPPGPKYDAQKVLHNSQSLDDGTSWAKVYVDHGPSQGAKGPSRVQSIYLPHAVAMLDKNNILLAVWHLLSVAVIGHGLMLLLSIAKWCNLLNSQLLVYNSDRQAPLDLLNLLPE